MRIHASWRSYPRAILGVAEQALVDWIGRNASTGETWLDVGAHFGYTSLAFCRGVGPSGRVFAFEPSPSAAGALSATAEANDLSNLFVVPVALGEGGHALRREFTQDNDMVMATLEGGRPSTSKSFLSVVSLDATWNELCGDDPRISGIKIDVQGMEAETVRGMRELLQAQRPRLIVEYHAYADLEELLDGIESAGYGREGKQIEPPVAGQKPYDHGLNYEFVPSGSSAPTG